MAGWARPQKVGPSPNCQLLLEERYLAAARAAHDPRKNELQPKSGK